jgi:small multidrug resistance pump
MFVAWGLLMSAIGVEVAATAALPRTEGFRDPWWTAAVLGGYAVSIFLLTVVIREIPVSIAYAVWAGLGTAGIAIVGIVLLGERFDVFKAAAIGMIIAGVVALNLQGAH